MEGEIVHYEIPAKNPAKLSKFYANVLGWNFKDAKMPGMKYWVAGKMPKATNGMYKKSKAAQNPINYIAVKNIDASVKKLKANGGKVVMPKMPVPGMGWTVMARDPEGNALGLFQNDPKAKMPQKK